MASHSGAPSSIGAVSASVEGVEIRRLSGMAEYADAARLQAVTWGPGYTDIVPASVLKVAGEVGGLCLGAFSQAELVGFVFGLTGPRDGEVVHWSHMLAVVPDWQDRGVGRALKHAQASALRDLGVQTMLWTFDPLVARNAHLNISRLRASVFRYVQDMYGDTGSAIHAFGTDRFVVRWQFDQEFADPYTPEQFANAPVLDDGNSLAFDSPMIRVPIPRDIEAIHAQAPKDALDWRARSRVALTTALSRGFRVVGFRCDGSSTCHYLLDSRKLTPPS